MAFGLNRAEVIGRLGADVSINHLTSGGRVANLSIATDESYIDITFSNRILTEEIKIRHYFQCAVGKHYPSRFLATNRSSLKQHHALVSAAL